MCRGCRFCPSVFFYLLSVVPAIWFLELHEMERRIEDLFEMERRLKDLHEMERRIEDFFEME